MTFIHFTSFIPLILTLLLHRSTVCQQLFQNKEQQQPKENSRFSSSLTQQIYLVRIWPEKRDLNQQQQDTHTHAHTLFSIYYHYTDCMMQYIVYVLFFLFKFWIILNCENHQLAWVLDNLLWVYSLHIIIVNYYYMIYKLYLGRGETQFTFEIKVVGIHPKY